MFEGRLGEKLGQLNHGAMQILQGHSPRRSTALIKKMAHKYPQAAEYRDHRSSEDAELNMIAGEYLDFEVDSDYCISRTDAPKLLRRLVAHAPDEDEVSVLLREVDQNGDGRLDFHQFLQLWHRTLRSYPELDDVFAQYAAGQSVMSPEAYEQFLMHHQGLTQQEACSATRRGTSGSKSVTRLDFYGAFSSPDFLWVPPATSQPVQPMDRPLLQYWCFSSHNTYLAGNQLTSKSDCGMYKRAFELGCRCVELDCWDGANGEPIIYHGHTATSKILFADVIQTIHDTAFVTSPWPVILSLEVHCSLPQQQRMAQIMVSIFGKSLKLPPKTGVRLDSPEFSPQGLRRRIILKNKVLPERYHNADGPDSDKYDDVEGNPRGSPKEVDVHPELSDITCMMTVKLTTPQQRITEADPFEVSSLVENKAEELVHKQLAALRILNTKCFSRIYPHGARIDSSNYRPLPLYAAGCHMVALNLQTNDLPVSQTAALFATNGNCGYVLKPPHVLGHDNAAPLPVRLAVEVVCGRWLNMRQRVFSKAKLAVALTVDGPDVAKPEDQTTAWRSDVYDPEWRETFEFTVADPALSTLTLTVIDGHEANATSTAMIHRLRRGHRIVPLYGDDGALLPKAHLLVRIQTRTSSSGALRAHAIGCRATRSNGQVCGQPKDESRSFCTLHECPTCGRVKPSQSALCAACSWPTGAHEGRKRSPVDGRKPSPVDDRKPSFVEGRKPSPVDGRKPSFVEGRKPSPVDGRKPSFVEGRKPSPVDGRKPSFVEGRKPSPVDGRKPSFVEGRKPSPVDGRKPSFVEGRKPSPVDGRKPSFVEGRKPSPVDDRKPSFVEGRKPSPVDGRKPSFVEGRKPSPVDDRKPSFQEGRKPSPVDGRKPSFVEGRKPSPVDGRKPGFAEDHTSGCRAIRSCGQVCGQPKGESARYCKLHECPFCAKPKPSTSDRCGACSEKQMRRTSQLNTGSGAPCMNDEGGRSG